MKSLIVGTIFYLLIIIFFIYNRKKLGPKLTVLFVFIILFIIITGSNEVLRKEKVKTIIRSNRVFSIGKVVKYSPSRSTGRGPSVGWVKISFDDRFGRTFERQSSILLPTDYTWGEPDGKDFMVIYDSLDTKNCILLFDYPVKDSNDYFRYMEEFKIKPPSLKGGGWFSED